MAAAVFLLDGDVPEPTLYEYAEILGMDLERDADLLWIAEKGLRAPLPEQWKACATAEDGEVFFFNVVTGESQWDHPLDEHYRQMYHAADEARDKSTRVVTVSGLPEMSSDEAVVTVTCDGTLSGTKITTLTLRPWDKVWSLRRLLANRLGLPLWRVQMQLPSGLMLPDAADDLRVETALNISSQHSRRKFVCGRLVPSRREQTWVRARGSH